MKKIQYTLVFSLYAFTLFTVVATANLDGFENCLQKMTQENGFFETLTLLFLLSISIYGIITIYFHKRTFSKSKRYLLVFISMVTFLAAMEEMSWGQHLFHFSSSEYFLEHNLQEETNLHNFIDSNLFSSIIYTTLYIFFVFIPLFSKTIFKDSQFLKYFNFNRHHILIMLFASSLQLYFYDDFGVKIDMLTHLSGLLSFAYLLWKEKASILLLIHYFMVVMSTGLFMLNHHIFHFLNMQYEIREMFVVLALLFIFIEFIQREKA